MNMGLYTRWLAFLFLMTTFNQLVAADSRKEILYLASGGHLTVYNVDQNASQKPVLKQVQSLPLSGAGPFAFSPDGQRMYVVSSVTKPVEQPAQAEGGKKKKKGKKPKVEIQRMLTTCAVSEDGQLKIIKSALISDRPGYLNVDATGQFVMGNHYRAGNMGVWELKDGIYEGELERMVKVDSKAHSVLITADNKFIFVPTTGPNRVYQFRLDAATGSISPNEPTFAEVPLTVPEDKKETDQPNHPRHLVFHPTLDIAYTTLESRMPGVGVWDLNKSAGSLTFKQSLLSVDKATFEKGSTADLHLSPDAKHLYVSNRAENSSLALFNVNPKDGTLTFVKRFPCENVPRSFWVSPLGNFVFVAGQKEAAMGVYARNHENGHLSQVEKLDVGDGPIWVESLVK